MKHGTGRAARSAGWTGLLAGLLLMGGSTSFAGVARAVVPPDGKEITVTILLYSGRPDPTYVLDGEEVIDEIRAAITGAEPVSGRANQDVIPPILGYKGIQVQNKRTLAGIPSRIHVFEGRITVVDGQRRVLLDKNRALERILLEEAIKKGVMERHR